MNDDRLFRIGSRPSQISRLEPGESLFLCAPRGRLAQFMSQIRVDIARAGMSGQVSQSLVLGVEPSTREVYELVKLSRSK